MKHIAIVAAALTLGGSAPAAAQTTTFSEVKKIELKGPTPSPAATAPAAPAKALFGCDARKPNVCRFTIFYVRGGRDVFLPAGTKVEIPDVRIGTDSYCVEVNKKPAHKCQRKVINAQYNS